MRCRNQTYLAVPRTTRHRRKATIDTATAESDLDGGSQSLYFNTSNNRITGWSYDAEGNLLSDGSHSYAYDAENKIAKVDTVSAYVYDGEGQRVRKLVGENTRFVYGVGGQLIAEFSGVNGSLLKEYIYSVSGLLTTVKDASGISTAGRLLDRSMECDLSNLACLQSRWRRDDSNLSFRKYSDIQL